MYVQSEVVVLAHATPSTATTASVVATPSPHTLPSDTNTAHPPNFWWVVVAVLAAFFIGRLIQFMRDTGRGIGPKRRGGGA